MLLLNAWAAGMTQRPHVEAAQLLDSGNGGGNGGAIAYQLGGGDDGEAGEQLSALPLAVAVVLCVALYPALESLAPSPAPAMAVAVPETLQLAVPAASARARKAKETRAVDVEALVKAFEPSSEGASEVSESNVLALA